MKYGEIFELGKEKLTQAGIAEAILDARLLLEYICKTNRNDLLVHADREVTGEQQEQYLDWIQKRSEHIPLQHLTGVQEFMGLEFKVNEHVLIPRQDTETLVEEILKDLHDGSRILDMCTGSGCILISLLHYSNDCQGTGVDISTDALTVAKQNAENLLKDKSDDTKIQFVESDLFEKIEGKFDILVSNPPYICSSVIPELMEEVRAHEPLLALDGTEDGLFFYRKIVRESGQYLHNGGSLFFEIGYDQGEAVAELMQEAGFLEVKVVKDLAGLDRVVCGNWRG